MRLKIASAFGYASMAVLALGMSAVASAPAQAKKSVKVCAILPTSGANAAIGIGMMNSMDLAVKELNASGKLGEIEIELVKLDDGGQASVGISAVLRAASDANILACSAHFNSPVALATNDVFKNNGLANLVPAAINWKITAEQKGDEIFRISPSDVWQVEKAALFPVKVAGKKSLYLIDDSTQYGKSLVTAMDQYVTAAGGQKIGSDSIAVGEKDFTAVLTKAKSLKPDVIFFGGQVSESALIRQQMVKLGMDSLFYTGSGTMSPTFVATAGPAAEGTYAYFYGLPYDAYPGGKTFSESYKKAGYDKPHETYGIWAYACMEVLASAIVKADAKGKLNRRGIIDEMKAETFKTVIGDVSFPRPGDIAQKVMAYYAVQKGAWVMTHYSKPDGTIVAAGN